MYFDIPGNFVMSQVKAKDVRYVPRCPPPPKMCASTEEVRKAVDVLSSAKKPLVIVGKGKLFGIRCVVEL